MTFANGLKITFDKEKIKLSLSNIWTRKKNPQVGKKYTVSYVSILSSHSFDSSIFCFFSFVHQCRERRTGRNMRLLGN